MFSPIESSACWASMLSYGEPAGELQDAHGDEDRAGHRGHDPIVVAQPAERLGGAVEGDGGDEERDREAGPVGGQQHTALVDGLLDGGGVRIEPSVGPMHGVQATANAAPAISGPPLPARCMSASTRHSRLSRRMNGVSTKKAPSTMIMTPAICSSMPRWSLSVEPTPVALIPSATNTIVKSGRTSRRGAGPALGPSPSRISPGDTPQTARQVAGTIGSTQGEMKETKPTAKAAKTVVSTPRRRSQVVPGHVAFEPRRVGVQVRLAPRGRHRRDTAAVQRRSRPPTASSAEPGEDERARPTRRGPCR